MTAAFRGRGGDIFRSFYLTLFAAGCGVAPRFHSGTHIRIFSLSVFRTDHTWWELNAWEHPWAFSGFIAAGLLLWRLGVLGQLHGGPLNFLAALTIIGWA